MSCVRSSRRQAMFRMSRSFLTRTYVDIWDLAALALFASWDDEPRLTFHILQAKGYNYGFIEYDDPGAAERAMQTLNGRRVHQSVTTTHSSALEAVWHNSRTNGSCRKSGSTGLIRQTRPARRILPTTSISLLVTCRTKSTMRFSSRPSPPLAPSPRPVSCGT